ncbi:endonuclease/exonuclease/phosphatase family protein [Streptomyces millisiae]|uniref:Endonuclease/exonuclease/phosphatase family protein n=1 Tax=Streptomyces millisiae TaxID=3075542 RepID=A0ABU2LKX8_9ACTN|nr:endonuclease/exonuclease/phosphatase family protein [Streptomyces sp. DSM 44918]MDT0318240.1 endonuclease/exonuclease/phosphatase family protein [Streptomyces sp. DSM 44918]
MRRRRGLVGALAAALLAVLGVVTTGSGQAAAAPVSLRVLNWNVQGGQGTDGVTDFSRIVSVIRQQNPDVVTLQELHDNRAIGGENQWQTLLDAFPGYQAHFARSDDNAFGGSAGNLILSRYPILERLTALLPQYPADTTAVRRSLGGVRIDVGGTDVRVYTTHLSSGVGAEATERRNRQAREVVDRVSSSATMRTPMLLTGDLNARPDNEIRPWFAAPGWLDAWTQLNPNTGAGTVTLPGNGDDARIDYVYATPSFDVTAARTVTTSASDHRPVVVDVAVHEPRLATTGTVLAGAGQNAGWANATAYADNSVRLRVCDNLADGWGVRAYVSANSGSTRLLTGNDPAFADRCYTFNAPAGTVSSPVVRVCLYQGTVEKECREVRATAG